MIIDISPPISEKLAVFPGDTPFQRTMALDMVKGDHLTLSDMRSTLHLGAHADATNHYHAKGEGIEKRKLETYLGLCQVIEVHLPMGARILDIGDIQITAPRVLFKTGSFPDPNTWNGDFNSLSAPLIDFLARAGVVLVGIDTPSVDPAESKTLDSHQALFRTGMAVLEGLDLRAVDPGNYNLIALPLAIVGADASPVRAVLQTL